jgi:hypothetical protein
MGAPMELIQITIKLPTQTAPSSLLRNVAVEGVVSSAETVLFGMIDLTAKSSMPSSSLGYQWALTPGPEKENPMIHMI